MNPLIQTLTQNEEVIAEAKLYSFFTEHLKNYTAGESSSVSADTANELFTSLCFVLNLYLKENDLPYTFLAEKNTGELFQCALSHIKKKVDFGKKLYEYVKAQPIDNISMSDTLMGINMFLNNYNYRYFAHMTDADIDYQLCIPVSEKLKGIEYINSYLAHLAVENTFIGRFGKDNIQCFLERRFGDYRSTILNLFEPIFACSLGLELAGKDVFSLVLTKDDIDKICDMLFKSDNIKGILKSAVLSLCSALHLNSEKYLISSAYQLIPRINVSAEAVFTPSFL